MFYYNFNSLSPADELICTKTERQQNRSESTYFWAFLKISISSNSLINSSWKLLGMASPSFRVIQGCFKALAALYLLAGLKAQVRLKKSHASLKAISWSDTSFLHFSKSGGISKMLSVARFLNSEMYSSCDILVASRIGLLLVNISNVINPHAQISTD